LNTKGSKILDIESGIIYDGGEFARKEIVKYDQNEERMMEENTISTVVHGVERLVEERAKNILESQTVKITREALDKAYKIAERMIAVSQAENEIYMNGTNFIDRRSDPVIRDVYILKNQIVTFGKCKPVGSDDEDFKEWKESGKYELAWMHSHAMIPPRHSPEDDRNLAVMTKYSADGIKTKIDLSDISILGYKINEKKSSLMLTLYPSIVVNAKRERSYVGIGASYSLPVKIPSSEKSPLRYFSRRNVPLEILDESNLIDSTTESIERIIWERVKWDGKEKSKGLERRVKPSPSWSELEKVILKYPSAIDATPIEDYDRNGKGVVRNGRSYLNKVNQIATMVFGRRKARNREMIWKKNHPKKVEASEVL
jgi:hypothetical protein